MAINMECHLYIKSINCTINEVLFKSEWLYTLEKSVRHIQRPCPLSRSLVVYEKKIVAPCALAGTSAIEQCQFQIMKYWYSRDYPKFNMQGIKMSFKSNQVMISIRILRTMDIWDKFKFWYVWDCWYYIMLQCCV